MRVSDDVLEGLVAGVEVGELAAAVNHLHRRACHGEGERGLAGPRVSDEDDALFVARQALGQLEAVREVLVALRLALGNTSL